MPRSISIFIYISLRLALAHIIYSLFHFDFGHLAVSFFFPFKFLSFQNETLPKNTRKKPDKHTFALENYVNEIKVSERS